MRRFLASIAVAVCALTVVGAGIALAADLEIVPSASDDGLTELTIDILDFDPNTAIYVLPCDVPASGLEVDVSSDTCQVAAVTVGMTDDAGNATIVVTWTIPPEGVAVYVGDEQGANQITQVVGPTVIVEGPAESIEEIPEVVEEPPEAEVLGTNVVQDDLAESGPREILLGLLLVGTAMIAVGSIASGVGRALAVVPNRH